MTTTADESLLTRRRVSRAPSARSLLLTVLGEYVLPRGEPAWTTAFVRGLGLLGVGEKAARQALARTAAEGWLRSVRHGRLARWELTAAGRRLLSDGAARIYSFGRDDGGWDRHWLVLIVPVPQARSDLRRRLRTRLAWAGFGALPGGAWISADTGRESEAQGILADLGLAGTSMSFIARYGDIGAQAAIVDLAWDLGTVERRYAEFVETFAALDPAHADDTLVAQTLLVHEWRRFPSLDPRLPRDLLPVGWLGAEAAALFRGRHERWHETAQRRWGELASP
jgi:phenylacetic acid degradation operon negative regulatory protein